MTIGETEVFVGSHHHGYFPVGWIADDGFGNGVYTETEHGPRPLNTMAYLEFMQDGWIEA